MYSVCFVVTELHILFTHSTIVIGGRWGEGQGRHQQNRHHKQYLFTFINQCIPNNQHPLTFLSRLLFRLWITTKPTGLFKSRQAKRKREGCLSVCLSLYGWISSALFWYYGQHCTYTHSTYHFTARTPTFLTVGLTVIIR